MKVKKPNGRELDLKLKNYKTAVKNFTIVSLGRMQCYTLRLVLLQILICWRFKFLDGVLSSLIILISDIVAYLIGEMG